MLLGRNTKWIIGIATLCQGIYRTHFYRNFIKSHKRCAKLLLAKIKIDGDGATPNQYFIKSNGFLAFDKWFVINLCASSTQEIVDVMKCTLERELKWNERMWQDR